MILLQSANSPNGGMIQLLFIAGMIVVFYFFMIRPQQKRQKDQKSFVDNLKQGDLVITTGGIHGRIISVDSSTALIEIDKGVKIKCEKSAISLEQSKTLQVAEKAA